MTTMLEPEDYLSRVLSELTPLPVTTVPLTEAHGLVLAEDVVAALPVPPWTNSAMDGYAVRAAEVGHASADTPVSLPVSGDVPAGTAPGPLAAGTAQRIMTGAMLPEGADCVIRVEDTDQEPGDQPLPARVEIRAAAHAGANVRRSGEDARPGDLVLVAGTVLSATALSCLASVGASRVRVVPRARVAVVSTGAELVAPGARLPVGSIPDSNAVLLAGLVAEHGGVLASVSRSGDAADTLSGILTRVARDADLVVTSGGVSAGAFDPLTQLAGHPAEGPVRLDLAKVAMQPGKPQGRGTVRTEDGRAVPLLALPGNPVSVLVSFTTIVAPALARLSGHDGARIEAPEPGRTSLTRPTASVRARAAAGWRAAAGRRQHVPVRFVPGPATDGDGGLRGRGVGPGGADGEGGVEQHATASRWVEPTHRLGSGSHLVASLAAAQALAVVEPGAPAVEVGDEVRLLVLSHPAAPGRGHCPPSPRARDGAPARGQSDAPVPPRAAGPTTPGTGLPGTQDPEGPDARAEDVSDAPVPRLTHLDEAGAARMVDVTSKSPTVRAASASAFVSCSPQAVAVLRAGAVPKGDVLAVARVAGIGAAKKVPELLPLAHVIGVHGCQVDLRVEDEGVRITSDVRTADRTGVEMEALTAVTVAGLAVVDMLKGIDRTVMLRDAMVTAKSGGRSGSWSRTSP